MFEESEAQKYLKRLEALKKNTMSWINHWRDISEYTQPRRGSFLNEKDPYNAGYRVHSDKNSGAVSYAIDILAAGMHGGFTSPTRPWFRLTLEDKKQADRANIKSWMFAAREICLSVLAKSRFYNSAHANYAEVANFGTASSISIEGGDGLTFRAMTVGECYFAQNEKYYIDTMYREIKLTVRQLVNQFGLDKCSLHVKRLYEKGEYEQYVDVVHLIEPRQDRDYKNPNSKNMPFRSVYFEKSMGNRKHEGPVSILKESGFKTFPMHVARWSQIGADVYGSTCPGMTMLGDIKMLNQMEADYLDALAKSLSPVMNAPSSMKGKVTLVPNTVNFEDPNYVGTSQNRGISPAFLPNINLQYLDAKIERVETKIKQGYYNDLFLMLANATKTMTATEVAERHEEKLLMLGPVVERLENEYLGPIIDRTFDFCLTNNLFPEPPEELLNVDIKVEYISLLSQAQKLVGLKSIEQTMAFAGNMAAVFPEIRHKIDPLQAMDAYAEGAGAPPNIIRSDEEAEYRVLQEQQQMAQVQQAQSMGAAAQGAKVLSEAELNKESVLDALMAGGK